MGKTSQVRTTDSFRNFVSRVGMNTPNQSAAGHYAHDFLSRNQQLMESAYATSWVCGQAVDLVAEDMTRERVDITTGMDSNSEHKLMKRMGDLGIWSQLLDAIKWSRLYGGAVAVHLIDGQDLSTSLRVETVGIGQYRGMYVLDRWNCYPDLSSRVTELGPFLGEPEYYVVNAGHHVFSGRRIHYTRMIRFDGLKMPYYRRLAENMWGQSILERLWDRLIAFDSATQGAAQLVYKAHLRTYSVEKLRQIIAQGGKVLDALVQQVNMIRLMQSNEGITMMDSSDKYEAHQYTFSGLSDILLQFGQQISGATGIPLVRFFGQSPAGLNSTGESDLRNYNDMIKAKQEKDLRPGLTKTMEMVSRSINGQPLPDDFGFVFNPLWQLTPEQRSSIASQTGGIILQAYDSQAIGEKTAKEELKRLSETTGVFSSITELDILAASNEPPEPEIPPGFDPGMPFPTGDDFDESKVKRDGDGKFSTSGSKSSTQGGSSSTLKKVQRSKLPPHIQKLGLPPAWTDLRISDDPNANLLATGKDSKGRTQYVYNPRYSEEKAAQKFAKVNELLERKASVEAKVKKDAGEPVADCTALIMAMGLRPGSTSDTKAEVQAYGATTLEGRHVVEVDGETKLEFTGKKGVALSLPVPQEISDMVKSRAKKAGKNGKLFPGVTEQKLREYTKDVGSVNPKGFRTALATEKAHTLFSNMPLPKTEKERERGIKQVAKQVAALLGNTPAVALKAYISPAAYQHYEVTA